MSLFNFLLLFSMIALVWGDHFTIPTPFLAKKHSIHQFSALLESIRGGSDNKNVYDKDADEETVEEEEWEDYEEEDEEIVLTDGPESALEESEQVDEEVFAQEVFDEENETTEEQVEVFEEDLEEVVEDEDEMVVEEPDDDETTLSFVDSMEQRIATTTDDENSSSFVDRMELADAYDEADTTVDQEDKELAAVKAATAIGVGGSEEEQVDEAPEGEAAEDEDVAVLAITDDMKKILIKTLKYKANEVKNMRPEIATTVIEKSLQRPPEGIPQNWYIEGAKGKQARGLRENALKISVTIVALGGVAVLGGKGDALQKVFGMVGALKSMVPTKSAPAEPLISSTTAVVSDDAAVTTEAQVEEDEDHPHSVKPYSHEVPSYEEDLDKSWLDRALTKIENAFKAFFRIKI